VARQRLGVVILLPPELAAEVTGLRRAIGSPSLSTLPPHITLVPPINVREDEIDRAITIVRKGASQIRQPIALHIGPVATFAPVSPVVYLSVNGDIDELVHLRQACLRPPLERRIEHDFVPHVTLHEEASDPLVAATMTAMSSFSSAFVATHVDVLRQDDDRVWRSIAEVPIGERIARGRGTFDVVLTQTEVSSPDVLLLLRENLLASSRVLEARTLAGDLIGVLIATTIDRDGGSYERGDRGEGSVVRIDRIVLDADHRGIGMSGRLVDELLRSVEGSESEICVELPRELASFEPSLERRGFRYLSRTPIGALFVR
jgi:2'-5' RNA ligase/predicted GNAT family N-acyltransferase